MLVNLRSVGCIYIRFLFKMGRTWFMNYKHNLTDIFSLGGIKTKNKYALPKSACQSILHHENAVALHTQGIKQLC